MQSNSWISSTSEGNAAVYASRYTMQPRINWSRLSLSLTRRAQHQVAIGHRHCETEGDGDWPDETERNKGGLIATLRYPSTISVARTVQFNSSQLK